jgi:phosphoketolase
MLSEMELTIILAPVFVSTFELFKEVSVLRNLFPDKKCRVIRVIEFAVTLSTGIPSSFPVDSSK